MYESIHVAQMDKHLPGQLFAFAFRHSHINVFDFSGDDSLRIEYRLQSFKAMVGHLDYTKVRFLLRETKGMGVSFDFRQHAEQSTFTTLRKANYPDFHMELPAGDP